MRREIPVYLVLATCMSVLSFPAQANEPEFVGSSASHIQTLDCDTKAKNFDPFTLGWLVDGSTVDGGERSIRCATTVTNERDKGRKGVKVKLTGDLIDPDNGQSLGSLGSRSGRTNGAGQKYFDFNIPSGLPDDYLAAFAGSYGGSKKGVSAETTCTAINRVRCQAGDTTACLLDDGRFKVNVDWRSSSGSGPGQVISSGLDDALFFFDPNTGDLLVQLLNRCANNNHFWVFYDAATNVELDLTVTDTMSGETKSYFNPLGQAARAITDTSAFATCP